jgi:NAD-dependent deacetylase
MRSTRNLWPEAPSILILTGAGISQESGLATFRDADGIWANVRLEEVATPEAFARDRRACKPSTMRGGASCNSRP